MDLFDLFCKISIDDSDFTSGVQRAAENSRKLLGGFQNIASTISGVETSFSTAGNSAGDMSGELKKAASGVDEVGSALDEAGDKSIKFGDLVKANITSEAIINGIKTLANNIKTLANGIYSIGKQALDGYADYEQLVGGVETLFKNSSDIVLQYANNAYKTAGLSANAYMETVTSFSASLLQSLNNDTAAAAEKADLAITDMSDNANKMGTAMESIQNAYQGFAKQNFTMLDNLKLGYGGTKEEMGRLLEDAEKIAGLDPFSLNINSFDDIVTAIHIVQTEMGITGTTAKEAASTISGSIASMKSAWTNLLTGMADENADIDILIGNFVDSVETASENVIPRISKILEGIGDLVVRLAPIIEEKLPDLIKTLLPGLISAVGILITSLAAAIPKMLPALADAALQVVDEIEHGLSEKIPGLSILFENLETVVIAVTAAMVAYKAAVAISGLVDKLRQATEAQTVAQIALNAVMNANPFVLIATLIAGVVTALIVLYNTNEDFRNKVNAAWSSIKNTISGVVSAIVTLFTVTVPNAGKRMISFFKSIPSMALQWGKDMIQNFINGIKAKLSALKSAVTNVAQTVKNIIGFSEPEEGPLSNFHTYAPDMMQLFAQGITDNAGLIKSAFDKSLNFGTASVDYAASGIGMSSQSIGDKLSSVAASASEPITIIVQSVLDGRVIGETAYQYSRDRQRAYGI